MPELHIVAGSNGAGKSTIGASYIPSYVLAEREIFDGDKLYMQKRAELWKAGIRVNKQIKEIADDFVSNAFDKLVSDIISHRKHFAYEGHFSEANSWATIARFKEEGYSVNMIFFGLRDTYESELRVLARVNDGGHNVPLLMIETNFYGNLHQLNHHFTLLDSLKIFDTSTLKPLLLAQVDNGKTVLALPKANLPVWFTNYLPAIVQNI